MDDFLILRLQGVMQAWGYHTFEDYRPSQIFPTRSGVVGLLAACLGIDRGDQMTQKSLSDSFIYAARSDARSYRIQKLTDFHTILEARKVDGSKNDNPIISTREYLCDAHFTLSLQFKKDAAYDLNTIKEALQRPVYTPFLGRRSCPLTRPLFDSVVKSEDLHSALSLISPGQGTIYSELSQGSPSHLTVRDLPSWTGRRQFIIRTVYIHAPEADHVPE